MSSKSFGVYKQVHNKTTYSTTDPNITKTLLSQLMPNNSFNNNFNQNIQTQTTQNESQEQEVSEKESEPTFTQMQENTLTNEQIPLYPK